MKPRRSRPSGPGTRAGFLERFLFSFMGPPQVGDVNAPSTAVPDPAAALCHRCAQPWDEHEIVRTPSRTYANCPKTAVDQD